MIVISNQEIDGLQEEFMTFDKFYHLVFEEGSLEVEDDLVINVEDVSQEIYEALDEYDFIHYFTLTGNYPDFMNPDRVEDWSEFVSDDENEDQEDLSNVSENEDHTSDDESTTSEADISNDDNVKSAIPSDDYDKQVVNDEVRGLLDESLYDIDNTTPGEKDARIIVFGSSKGGTGKTFTSIMSTYRYAKTHPRERIALVDFDIIDGQVGVSIHKIKPTMRNYLTEYQKGYQDFETMHNFCVHGNNYFPQNVDFYLAPNNGVIINNDEFWFNIIDNCIKNYDVVVFDTGIDYLNIAPISFAYKIADKINLVTTTSIKSVNSVTKQIGKLKGETRNNVFTPEDEIGPKLNIIITQMVPSNKEMNETIFGTLSNKCNVVATFGVLTESISQAEYYGAWNVFDQHAPINKSFDAIMA